MSMSPQKSRWKMLQGYHAHRRGDLKAALRCYDAVLRDDPRNPIALHYAALLAAQVNQFAKQEHRPELQAEAMRLMAMSVVGAPDNAAAVHNFAKFKHDAGELEDARDLYLNAVTLDASLGESWTNLGNVFGEIGDREAAEECWNRALECPTASDDARFNLSMLKLLRGNYAEGWADYEARWGCPGFRVGYGRPDLERWPKWDGEPTDGTVVVHAEQGVGDALMMARYIPLAAARVGHLVIEVQESAESLFQETFGTVPNVTVVPRGHVNVEHPGIVAQLSFLSFPATWRTTVETVPPPVRFRYAPTDPGENPTEPGRIGLCWKGSASHTNDRTRSMPVDALAPILALEGFRFQSLQFGVDDVAGLEPLIATDYRDTAREVARCELVITVDTSIAHLAASMGVETWILLPFHAEWRWMQDRKDSPWYPTAALWRQSKAGDWRALTEEVARFITSLTRDINS